MALIGYGDMIKHVIVFPTTCLSLYAFPGIDYQETSVGFIFLRTQDYPLNKKSLEIQFFWKFGKGIRKSFNNLRRISLFNNASRKKVSVLLSASVERFGFPICGIFDKVTAEAECTAIREIYIKKHKYHNKMSIIYQLFRTWVKLLII